MPALQKFDYLNSRYERPNQDWICGRAADGCACRNGPDRKGRCCGVAECSPVRDGDRWICTRPSLAGGPCDSGPMGDGSCAHPIPPCVPVRTLRAKRGLAVRWTVALTIGFLALVVGSAGLNWLMPGALITAHASLQDCRSCHANVPNDPFAWATLAFMHPSPEKDSNRCVGCHVTSGSALAGHGVPPAVLAASTERIKVRLGAGAASEALHGPGSAVPCATCHVEHGGEKAKLANVAETACQACHVSRFDAFSKDHPEFEKYPYERRTRLVFDHGTHIFGDRSYFAKEADKKKLDAASLKACVNCHAPEEKGGLMLVKPFERTCAGCHLKDDILVGDHLPSSVAVLSVPGLDLAALEDAGIDIGDWPGESEAVLTPVMRLLLSADSKAGAALETLKSVSLLNLGDHLGKLGSEEERKKVLEAVKDLTRGIKVLFFELHSAGPGKFAERLSRVAGKAVEERLLSDLFASLPRDVLLALRCETFPNLASELGYAAKEAAGECRVAPKVTAAASPRPVAAAASRPKDTGDILSGARDTGDILSGTKDTGDILSGAKDTGDILSGTKDTGDILSGAKDTGDILSGTKDTGDILSGARDTGDILSGTKDTGDILSGAKDTGDILSGAKDTGDILAGAVASEVVVNAAADSPKPPGIEILYPQEFARIGGWYRQDYSIALQPSRHVEPFLKAWLDFAASGFGTPAQPIMEPLFRELTRKNALGKCIKCHSVDKGADGSMSVQWQPKRSGGSGGGFTRFRHGPHLSLAPDRSCGSCHVADDKARYRDAFLTKDDRVLVAPAEFATNFKAISRQVCSECHTRAGAGESCIQCHNYHAEPFVPVGMMPKSAVALGGREAP